MLEHRILLKRTRLPHFLVLGTQKGGTTSLQRIMENHLGLFMPECKEVQYFTLNNDKPVSWYADHYKNAGWKQKRGDITPFYLFHPKAAERIYKVIPKAKLIVLLRDPVDRTISQYFHAKRLGFETLTLSEALDAEEKRLTEGGSFSFQKHSYVARSRYLEQLDRYESLFAKDKILVIKSEDLFYKSNQTWELIQRFLEIERIPLPMKLPKENSGKGEAGEINTQIRNRLEKEFKKTKAGVKERYGLTWSDRQKDEKAG